MGSFDSQSKSFKPISEKVAKELDVPTEREVLENARYLLSPECTPSYSQLRQCMREMSNLLGFGALSRERGG